MVICHELNTVCNSCIEGNCGHDIFMSASRDVLGGSRSVQRAQTLGQTELAHTLIRAPNMALTASYDVTRYHLGLIHKRVDKQPAKSLEIALLLTRYVISFRVIMIIVWNLIDGAY